jgi:peptide/nickel transport system permease protein
MIAFILGRLAGMVPVLFLVSLVVFMIIHLTPGDPVLIMLGEEANTEARARLRSELGFDQPLPVQYAVWIGRVVHGDLGRSIRTAQPVSEAILQRLPVTIELAIAAMVVGLLIAIPAGIVSALRRNSGADIACSIVSLLGVSMPNFFLAILLITVFSLWLRWLPPLGFTPIIQDPLGNLKGLIMPAITLGAALAAVISRQMRGSLLDVLQNDYIRTAWSKGLREDLIINRHALKNAMIPVVTVAGLRMGNLLGAAIITETIFALPGVGRMVVDSIFQRDFPMVQGVVLYLACIFLLINLAVDLVYAYLDPRIRYG